jgi:tetratricopeptide (TPR) repeat protein
LVSDLGFDVTFSDLEGDKGGFDFLAQRDGRAFEIEGKCVPAYLGQAISPEDAEKFFIELPRRFNGWTEKPSIPILDVKLSKRLEVNSASITELVQACNAAARGRNEVLIEGYARVRFVGAVSETAKDHLIELIHTDRMSTFANMFLSTTEPGVVVRLSSDQDSRFAPKVLATLREAAKCQFTGSRPGIIWLHVDYLAPELFNAFGYRDNEISLFDLIALAILDSPKRSHLCQLVFTGGSYFQQRGDYGTSSFRRVVYNAPNCRFGNAVLFTDGRNVKSFKEGMGEKAKSLLRSAKVKFTMASGPREASQAMATKFLERLCGSYKQGDRAAAVGILFHEALRLGEQGRFADATKFYDVLLPLLPFDDDNTAEAVASASCFNRGNMLSRMGKHEDALQAYEAVVNRFGESKTPEVAEKVARALFNSAKILEKNVLHKEQAIAMYGRICATATISPNLFPEIIIAQGLVNKGGLLGETEEAIATFDEVIGRFDRSREVGLREQVQMALVNKCKALYGMKRYADALQAANTSLAVRDPPVRHFRLWAHVWKIQIMTMLGREIDILDICDELQAGLEPRTDFSLKQACAQSLLKKASILKARGDRVEEIGVYDSIVSTLMSDVDREIVDVVVECQEEKANTLTALNRNSEALEICEDILDRCNKMAPPSASWEHVAWALTAKQRVLAYQEKWNEAAEVCSQIIKRFGPDSLTPLPDTVAKALAARAMHLHDLGLYEDALTDCEVFLSSFGSSRKSDLLEELAHLLLCKGNCLLNIGREADAKYVLRGLISRFEGEHSERITRCIAAAQDLLSDINGDE